MVILVNKNSHWIHNLKRNKSLSLSSYRYYYYHYYWIGWVFGYIWLVLINWLIIRVINCTFSFVCVCVFNSNAFIAEASLLSACYSRYSFSIFEKREDGENPVSLCCINHPMSLSIFSYLFVCFFYFIQMLFHLSSTT